MAARPSIVDAPPTRGSVERSYVQYRVALIAFFARRARERSSIEDLVQTVYERLLRYRPRTPVQDPEGYLFRTARRVLMRANHQARVRQERYPHYDSSGPEMQGPLFNHLWVEEGGGTELAEAEFERVLAQLPEDTRHALIRQRRDGWSYRQIAEELGISPNTVKDHIVRALEHFRIHFSLGAANRSDCKDCP